MTLTVGTAGDVILVDTAGDHTQRGLAGEDRPADRFPDARGRERDPSARLTDTARGRFVLAAGVLTLAMLVAPLGGAQAMRNGVVLR